MAQHPRSSPRQPEQAQTVTCRHCRYERPAGDARCHICGYPWPWVKSKNEPSTGKSKT